MTLAQIIAAAGFVLLIAIIAVVFDALIHKGEPLTESYSDPRIVGDDSRRHSALIRDMGERVEM